jgi:CRISPR/Cas system-associated protein Cas10 (large subunit of type III CRISPR-Cas system)
MYIYVKDKTNQLTKKKYKLHPKFNGDQTSMSEKTQKDYKQTRQCEICRTVVIIKPGEKIGDHIKTCFNPDCQKRICTKCVRHTKGKMLCKNCAAKEGTPTNLLSFFTTQGT